jgi:hypothetical protein
MSFEILKRETPLAAIMTLLLSSVWIGMYFVFGAAILVPTAICAVLMFVAIRHFLGKNQIRNAIFIGPGILTWAFAFIILTTIL